MKLETFIKKSVVAVITYEGQVFIGHRQVYLKAFPGYLSFPGGKIDKEDSTEPYTCQFLRDHHPQIMRGLCREIQEEIKFDLEQSIGNNQVSQFTKIGEALTPPITNLRFHTYFFHIKLKVKPKFFVSKSEFKFANWTFYENLILDFQKGKNLLAPPTLKVLKFLNNKEKAPFYFEGVQKDKLLVLEFISGMKQIPVKSDTLLPATHTNAFILGDKSKGVFLIDPSPNSRDELDKLMNTLSDYKLDGMFLTHHHPDHYEHSNKIAKLLKVPIFLSKDSFNRICDSRSVDYFKGVQTKFVSQDQVLTTWKGREIFVCEIPGHDKGHLGLAPRSMEWFLVGDLIQGIGTVVIAEPEGSMKEYFNTLKKVIALNPKIIIPSHGLPLGTTFRLCETLKHRQMREEQVFNLVKENKNSEQILPIVYENIPPELHKYAIKTIESHITKLKEEKRI